MFWARSNKIKILIKGSNQEWLFPLLFKKIMINSDKNFTRSEFLNFINDYFTSEIPLGIRDGQWLMITLCNHNQNVYKEITGTENDCFYNCTKIRKTVKYISEHFIDNILLKCNNN